MLIFFNIVIMIVIFGIRKYLVVVEVNVMFIFF